MRLITILSLFLCMFFSAHGQDAVSAPVHGEKTIIRLGPNMTSCSGFEGQAECHVFQEDDKIGGQEWSYLYAPLLNLEYEEGFYYLLEVQYDLLENPMQDQSKIRLRVIDVIEQEPTEDRVHFTH